MALTYGFYNSYAGDRKYDAMQISEMFDGILADGIIPSQGQLFAVTAGGGMTVNVGTGRAWFFHSWTKNDSVMMLTVSASDVSRPRIDAVVLEVNRDQEVRANSIKIVSGEAAVNPVKPTLVTTDKVHQYPLAYITVGAGVEEITAENIENAVGLTPTPFATGVLETTPLDELWNQWEGEWDTWFANIKLQLSGDIVANLQGQIDALREGLGELDGLKVVTNTYTKIFTSSGVFTNTYSSPLEVVVHAFGGGGGGNSVGGGGGGHRVLETLTVPANDSVNIEIGAGGSEGNSGGSTSFGSYVKATGGNAPTSSAGGSGGSGGGGKGPALGGDASYGGGGGAGGVALRSGGTSTIVGGSLKGGNGGTYGGGGGGGGGSAFTAGSTAPGVTGYGGSGGSGGEYGGNGGAGGNVVYAGSASTAIENGNDGVEGTNTEQLQEEFTGSGIFGSGGSGTYAGETRFPGTANQSQHYALCGGGGGGGGGYGGNGGNSGASIGGPFTSSADFVVAAGGGGGGGYGGNGGSGAAGFDKLNSNGRNITSAGGGGGGYGGNGGDAVKNTVNTASGWADVGRSGEGYGSGGGSTGNAAGTTGSGYSYSGTYATAGGGGGYGKTPASSATTRGRSGICIITYTVKEIVIE